MQIAQERFRELLQGAFIAGAWIDLEQQEDIYDEFNEYIEENEKMIPELLDWT